LSAAVTRILSDLHYGEHASRVSRLAQLRPLLDGADRLVLNGDTLDTRPGRDARYSAVCRNEVAEFFRENAPTTAFITGNHDADLSANHELELAERKVWVTHGDILFDNMVPWGRDAVAAGRRIAALRAREPDPENLRIERLLQIHRWVARGIPQRHQAERDRLRFIARYLADTIWPPHRAFLILAAWRTLPKRAAALARRHRPDARFIVTGHTHRRGIWRQLDGRLVINTGSYTLPLAPAAVDVRDDSVTVREIVLRSAEFRFGRTLGAFPLAATATGAETLGP
jgi:predicted phosphodiesterase